MSILHEDPTGVCRAHTTSCYYCGARWMQSGDEQAGMIGWSSIVRIAIDGAVPSDDGGDEMTAKLITFNTEAAEPWSEGSTR